MHLIPTRVHGFLDYSIGGFLIASPWLLAFAFGGAETWVPVGTGVASIGYSMFTNYELGLIRTLRMPVHLRLDFLASAFVLASPWLFAFSSVVHLPHVLLGLLGLGIVALSRPWPGFESAFRAEGSQSGRAGHA